MDGVSISMCGEEKYICCFSGGKDSTAMLIHILKNKLPLDEILYVDVGDWMWEYANTHIKLVESKLNVNITVLDATDELDKGFKKWGFPGFFNRWCTGVKRVMMRDYLKEKYPEEEITQYIGYCSDEEKRTSKKLYASYKTTYPLVEAKITTEEALQMCYDNGFDFEGVYEHHSHFNCWLCPLQRKSELKWIFENDENKWNILREIQHKCPGTFRPNETIFDVEKSFWKKNRKKLEDEMKKKRIKIT